MGKEHTLEELAYEKILEGITSGKYAAKMHLKESHLCHELQMSRTPIRRALSRLGSEGILSYQINHGMVVNDIFFTTQDLISAIEIRLIFTEVCIKKAKQKNITFNTIKLKELIKQQQISLNNEDAYSYYQALFEGVHLIFVATNNNLMYEFITIIEKKLSIASLNPTFEKRRHFLQIEINSMCQFIDLLSNKEYDKAIECYRELSLNAITSIVL
ncbi:GntR family transcriptional regulator [Bacillus thuringiensis]|nr:GntR family transcriptional regulator [Bacillus thuringiensis]MRB61481.1 GntR family transcriptional regulator [Bacillus thuringiensis]